MNVGRHVSLILILSVGVALHAQQPPATDAHWPQWRGLAGNGVAPGDAPLEWSDSKNVSWKIEIPGRGFSTPIIWGDRLFLTTAVPTGKKTPPAAPTGRGGGAGGGAGSGEEHDLKVMAIDRLSGKVLWQQTAITATPHEGYHRIYGSFASNTPATDGERLYAFFGSRGLYAYDMSGKQLWKKDFGQQMKMRLQFGEGTALVLHDGKLITVFDHQEEGLLAVTDAATGKDIWRIPRNEGSSWSTPLVVEHQGRKQVVVTATPKVMAYDLETGKLVWEATGIGLNPIPMPVQHGDIVYVMSGYRDPKLMAIRLGRTGDLTGTDAIVWEATRGLSYTPSPVLHDNILYLLTDNGQLSALNATTGEPYYLQQRLPKPYNFKASPIAVNGKLYLASEEGDVVVVRLGQKYEVLATNTLTDQSFIATPVPAAGDLYLRSRTHLFRISAR
jgi:outer membrane protein assembly factor BamB